ncbi:MAG: hypothetical protein SFU83_11035 [Meiothermus sp.]|nr:hypothetical protein [Meiothermus sp.]
MIESISPIRPYPQSWLDRLTTWVDRLPGPYWAYYVGLWLGLFGILIGIKWNDGTLPVGTLDARYLVYTLWGVYMLGVTHYLDRFASFALGNFRPALGDGEVNFAALNYQLTNSPPAGTLWSGILFSVWTAIPVSLSPGYPQLLGIFTSPLATAFELPLILMYGFITGSAIYHVVHQLATINRIYSVSTNIDPLAPQPLYSLSSLALRTALASALFQYLFIAVSPALLHSSTTLANLGIVGLISMAMVVWPLWGAHRLLLKEKIRLYTESQQRMKQVLMELHERIDSRAYDQVDSLNKTSSALQAELTMLERLPTWPWQPDTPRWLLTTILLPLLVWLSQRILSRLGL